jgi:hypothetical protein
MTSLETEVAFDSILTTCCRLVQFQLTCRWTITCPPFSSTSISGSHQQKSESRWIRPTGISTGVIAANSHIEFSTFIAFLLSSVPKASEQPFALYLSSDKPQGLCQPASSRPSSNVKFKRTVVKTPLVLVLPFTTNSRSVETSTFVEDASGISSLLKPPQRQRL